MSRPQTALVGGFQVGAHRKVRGYCLRIAVSSGLPGQHAGSAGDGIFLWRDAGGCEGSI